MPTIESIHYRSDTPGNHNNILTFTAEDNQFATLTRFYYVHKHSHNYILTIANKGTFTTNSDNPTAGENLYNPNPSGNTHVIVNDINNMNNTHGHTIGHVVLPHKHQFSFESPTNKAYFVKYPMSFICYLNAKTLTLYYNYAATAIQPTDPTTSQLVDGQSALLATNIQSCFFVYKPATATTDGMATTTLSLGDGTNNFSLMQQVRLTNKE